MSNEFQMRIQIPNSSEFGLDEFEIGLAEFGSAQFGLIEFVSTNYIWFV